MPATPFPHATPLDGSWDVADTWQQGRGAWGGLVAAAVVRAAEAAESVQSGSDAAARGVRSVSLQILAPVPAGPVRVGTALLRRGSSTASWRVELTPDEMSPGSREVLAHAVVVLGDPRAADVADRHGAAPDAPPWQQVERLQIGPPLGPAFAAHLEFRIVTGLPYTGGDILRGDERDIIAWVRPTGQATQYDAGALIAMADALWPTLLVAQTGLRPMATLTFDASLLIEPDDVDPALPLLSRSWLIGLQDGYFTEIRQLWTGDGRLAVHNTQTMVVIR